VIRRRGFLAALSLLAAPAIVRASVLMPVKRAPIAPKAMTLADWSRRIQSRADLECERARAHIAALNRALEGQLVYGMGAVHVGTQDAGADIIVTHVPLWRIGDVSTQYRRYA